MVNQISLHPSLSENKLNLHKFYICLKLQWLITDQNKNVVDVSDTLLIWMTLLNLNYLLFWTLANLTWFMIWQTWTGIACERLRFALADIMWILTVIFANFLTNFYVLFQWDHLFYGWIQYFWTEYNEYCFPYCLTAFFNFL